MIDNPRHEQENFEGDKPFQMVPISFPTVDELRLYGQMLQPNLANVEMQFFAQLPESFSYFELSRMDIVAYTLACKKLRVLTNLLQTTYGEGLIEVLENAVRIYRADYVIDTKGDEILYDVSNNRMYLSIHNGDDLIVQTALENINGIWVPVQNIAHFPFGDFNIEFRLSSDSKVQCVVSKVEGKVQVHPRDRDKNVKALINLPTETAPLEALQVFNYCEDDTNPSRVTHDFLSLKPVRNRIVRVFHDGYLVENFHAEESIDSNINAQAYIESRFDGDLTNTSAVCIYEADIDGDVSDSYDLLKKRLVSGDNLVSRFTRELADDREVPLKATAQYFKAEGVQTFEIEYSPEGAVDKFVYNGVEYLYSNGDFYMTLAMEGYYVLTLLNHGDLKRFGVMFQPDFGFYIQEFGVKATYVTSMDNNSIYAAKAHPQLTRTNSLN